MADFVPSALLVRPLDTGELPMFDIDSPLFYSFHFDEYNPRNCRWERRASRHRALLSCEVDCPVDYFLGMLPDWILDLEEACQEGTLILALRSHWELAPYGFFILACLG